MANNFLTVFLQVLTLFLMMAFGFAGGKRRMITAEGSKVMTDIVLYFVTPCVIINSFLRKFDKEQLGGLLICFVCSLLIHAFSIGLVHLLFHGKEEKRNRVLHFAAVFSNAGYMGLPLQQAVLGEDGLFYGSVYIAVFNVMLWTYGVLCMSGDKKVLSAKKLIFNPGIIGITVGLIVFLCSIPVPDVLSNVIGSMASLNTPLAMLVIGYYLSNSDLKRALTDKTVYAVAALRLLVIPICALGVMLLCGITGNILISVLIAASAPTAAATTMFATKFETDPLLSVNIVTVSTLFSILSMPLIVALAQTIGA